MINYESRFAGPEGFLHPKSPSGLTDINEPEKIGLVRIKSIVLLENIGDNLPKVQ